MNGTDKMGMINFSRNLILLANLTPGVEVTISQGIRSFDLRRTRYIGLAKTHFHHLLIAMAINLVRVVRWLSGEKIAVTRQSAFVKLHQPLLS